jgi:hypothetical protein
MRLCMCAYVCANDHTLIHAILCLQNYIFAIVPLVRNIIFLSINMLCRIIARKHIGELGSSHMQVQVILLMCLRIIFSCTIKTLYIAFNFVTMLHQKLVWLCGVVICQTIELVYFMEIFIFCGLSSKCVHNDS